MDVKVQDITNKKEIKYPSEVIFKAIFRNSDYTADTIRGILAEEELRGKVTSTESSTGKFISFTMAAVFPSEECLNKVCSRIGMIEGFMTMF